MDRSFLTDNPKLVDEIVCEVKSQGVFDQFRRNCIADVDTKPAYQNLRQRVESTVSNFLNEQVWRPDLNKNQLREKLRKHITEAGFLETGVERIVDQVVNPKINSVFLPKIEDISYKYLGIEKPKPLDEQPVHTELSSIKEEIKPIVLPTDLDDLEAVSPDSTGSKKSFKDSTEDLNTSVDLIKTELNDSAEKVDDDFESPAFEPLKGSLLAGTESVNGEELSELSDISGLTSQDSVNSEQESEEQQPPPQQQPVIEPELRAPTIEVIEQPAVTQSQQVIPENINQDSVLSQVSSNSHLSIVTDSNNKSSEVDICEEAQMPKFSENSFNTPDGDEKERKPLLTSFDIKQDEIKFEGTERRSSLHDFNVDIKMEEDVVMEETKESAQLADSMGDDSLMKTESSSSCIDPIISETKDLSLKDECRSNEIKFEEPSTSVLDHMEDMSGSSQNPSDKPRSKGERKSDSRSSEHKSHRRDKDKSSHHSRDRHKDGKHSSSKHSSSSSSSRKEHRSDSREGKKSTSSDHKRDESKSVDRSGVKSQSSSSSRDKDSSHKSSRSHDDKHDKSLSKDSGDRDKNRSRHGSSSHKSRSQHRERHSHDDDGKKKLGHESKSKLIYDDHAVHHEKSIDRRRSTDRDSDDGTGESGKPMPTNQQRDVHSSSITITNSTSSSSFSSTASSCTDEQEKRETTGSQPIAADSVHTSSTDSDDNFVPTSAPVVVVDGMLIGNEINLEMLMETNNMMTTDEDPGMCGENEVNIKKPKVASNIFEARKLMKIRKQMEHDKKKRLEKLLVHTKQLVSSTTVDEQGVELEFSVMNRSAPSISSPIKPKEIAFDGQQTPAPVNEKRNSGEFIIDIKEMEKQMKKKKSEKQSPPVKYLHRFDEILSQIDRPRKRDSKGSTSPTISPEKSPKFDPIQQRKLVREQSKDKKPTSTSQRDEKKVEKTAGRPQDKTARKDSSSSKSPPSPVKSEQKTVKSNKISDKNSKTSSLSSSKYEKLPGPSRSKQIKIEPIDSPKSEKVKIEPKTTKANTDEDEEDFCGFPVKDPLYVAVLDYVQVKEILKRKSETKSLFLISDDKTMFDVFSAHGLNVTNISGNNEKQFPVGKSGTQSREPKKTPSAKNGVRTSTTSQSQHKLFIENNQFADSPDVNQVSRKRRGSGAVQSTAAKIVRLVDSKISGDEETSPTPSEQSKENQIVHSTKKHNRTTDSCTSNEADQQSTERIESSKATQRYTSDDLYKPRPILSRSRRRGIENGEI